MTMDSSMCLDLPFNTLQKLVGVVSPAIFCSAAHVSLIVADPRHIQRREAGRERPTVDEDESKSVGSSLYSFTVGKLETLVAAELGPNL